MVELKSEVASRGGLHHRRELDGPADSDLDAAEWPASEARDVVMAAAGGRRLVERFRLRQRRLGRQHRLGDATLLVSLDEADVIAFGLPAGKLRQLEIELLDGDRAALLALARDLRASGLVRAQPATKMAQAAELATSAAVIRTTDRWSEAGRKVLRRHLLRLLEREPLARAGDNQALKQMRVATRRARATWRLFGDGFRRAARRRHVAALRHLGRALGEVRDLDVLLGATASRRRLAPLRRSWQARRDAAFADVLARLDGPQHSELVEHGLLLTETAAGIRQRRRNATVAERARDELRGAYTALVGDGAAPGQDAADEEWHALRIGSRRLRYAIEALRGAIGEPRSDRLIARLVRVQDHLGALNDAVVAAAEVDEWLSVEGASAAPDAQRAAATYRDERLREAAALRRSFAPVWRGVAGATFSQMLERALPDAGQGDR